MSLSLALITAFLGEAIAGPLLQPLIEIAPVSEVVADGTTQAHLYVIGVFKDGEPIDGMVLKPSTRTGRVGTLEPVGEGIYHFPYTPPSVTEPTDAVITVKGKTPDKRIVNITDTIRLVPADPFKMDASSNLSEMVLGRDAVTTVTFDQSPLMGDLAVRSSAGEVKGLTNMGQGSHKVQYNADRSRDPHLAIVTAVAESGISSTLGYQVIPQLAPATQDIEGTPDAHVVLTLGSREYGPVALSSQGTVKLPTELTPGVTTGTLSEAIDGATTTSDLTFEQPESRHVLLFPLPASIPANPQLRIKMWMLVLDPTGQPDGNASPTITASTGAVNKPVHIRDGIYEIEYTPAAEAGPLDIKASLGDDLQTDMATSELLALRDGILSPTSKNPIRHVLVLPEATQVRSDGVSEVPLHIITVDAYGQPVPNSDVTLVVRTGGGTFPETVTTDDTGHASVHYLSGREEFLVRVNATSGDASGATSFVQSPGEVRWNGVPIGGQEFLQEIETTWSDALREENAPVTETDAAEVADE
jgi:hypothetical protein